MLSSQPPDRGWPRYIWLVPAALAAVLVGLLCMAAWDNGYATRPLSVSGWRTALQTGTNWTLVTTMALLAAALSFFWWPRRRQRLPIGLICVAVMVVFAAVLGTVAYVPCRGKMSTTGILFWILQLFVGQPPNVYQGYQGAVQGAACSGPPPLALQLGQIDGLGATLIGALTVGSVLWRQPLDRLRSRFARDATIFTGLSLLTIPLLRQLAATQRNPGAIVVIEPDEANPLIEEARLAGARVVIGEPASDDLLRPVISAWNGCALNSLYALSNKVQQNEAVIAAAEGILSRYQPDQDRQPHLVALIDDPRHAEHWRGGRSGRSDVWFTDALSSAEVTARSVVAQVLRRHPRHLILCGDSMLTLVILLELARTAWEQTELVKAAASGGAAGRQAPVPLPLEDVVLLDLRSPDIRREYRASASAAFIDSLPDVAAVQAAWREELLRTLDEMEPDRARETVVIVTESPPGSGVHEAGRVARLHQGTPVFVLASGAQEEGGAIFDLLHPFEPGLLIEGEVPEDSWTRVARHWHECYRLSHPLPPGHPNAAARLPWSRLDPFLRQDNILQLRSVLVAVAARGRQWVPVRQVPAGSIIELSEDDLTGVAIAEHTRYYRRRLRAGLTGESVVSWDELPPDRRQWVLDELRTQLAQLEDVGFVPVVPAGGPPRAAAFERVGLVEASQLSAPLAWTTHAGEQMRGTAGDWRVVDGAGNVRTVTDPDFQSSHEPLGDGRWRRVGLYQAWQVTEPVVIRTKEGRATARPGDWVVESPGGERWPVRNKQFRWSYRPAGRARLRPGQATATAAASSSTPPASSS